MEGPVDSRSDAEKRAHVTALHVNGEWRSLEYAQHVSGTYDVALALENGDARLLRAGAPFAHAKVLRLQ